MRYLSVCSGIEAATVAWHPLGWTPAAFAEIEAFPRAVLFHHYPSVPLHGDFTTIRGDEYGPIDLLVGGTPCQDFSVAGLRAGIAGERGNLTLGFLQLAARCRPEWIVWENVPGVLPSDGGRALGTFFGGLAELGYGFAYRVLDAQYFNLAQRRERVFVVGCLGDWRRAAAVLFERESLRRDTPPRREARERVASVPPFSAPSGGGRAYGTDADTAGGLVIAPTISPALKSRDYKGPSSDGDGDGAPLIAHALRAEGFDASEDGTGRGTPLIAFGWQNSARQGVSASASVTPTLDKSKTPAIAFSAKDYGGDTGEIAPTLRAGGHTKSRANGGVMPAVVTNGVRRLTPRECERLQGFPDDYTLITYRGKPAADGPRYRALGNSMAVPVMSWIGRRIELVNQLAKAA